MKQIARCEFGGGLSEISLNKLIIKLIKKNIRIPSGSPRKSSSYHEDNCLILYYTLRSQFIYINLPC